MGNRIELTGNLGQPPELRRVRVKGADKTVCDLRIFVDEYRLNEKGGIEQAGGFWITGTVWDKRAETAVRLLQKGARVHVVGRLRQETWTNKDGEEVSDFRVTIDDFYLSVGRVQSVQYQPRQEETEATEEELA